MGKNLLARLLDFLVHAGNLFLQADFQSVFFGMFLKFVQLALQFDDGLLEVEWMLHGTEV